MSRTQREILKALLSAKGDKKQDYTTDASYNGRKILVNDGVDLSNDTALTSVDASGMTVDLQFKSKRYPYLKTLKLGAPALLDVTGNVEDLYLDDATSQIAFKIDSLQTYNERRLHLKNGSDYDEYSISDNLDLLTKILVRRYPLELANENTGFSYSFVYNNTTYTIDEINKLFFRGISNTITLIASMSGTSGTIPSNWYALSSLDSWVTISSNVVVITSEANGKNTKIQSGKDIDLYIGAYKIASVKQFYDTLNTSNKALFDSYVTTELIKTLVEDDTTHTAQLATFVNTITDANVIVYLFVHPNLLDVVMNNTNAITMISDYCTGVPTCNSTDEDLISWYYKDGIEPNEYGTETMDLENILSQTLTKGKAMFYTGTNSTGHTAGTEIDTLVGTYLLITKFFFPTSMPTKLVYAADEYAKIVVNGVVVSDSSNWTYDTETSIDFTDIIKLNQINNITAICFGGTTPNNIDVGLA